MPAEFHWDAFDAYLFDIDGTLLNSRDAVHYSAFHAALENVFRVQERIDTVQVHGNTDPGILRAVVRNAGISNEVFMAELPRALQYMREAAIANCGDMRPEICAGVTDLLAALRRKSKLLGLVSGNLEEIAWAKLRAAGIRDCFAFGSFSDRYSERRDIFAHGAEEARRLGGATVCVVGDTPNDIQAAHDCELPIIAVATGIYGIEQLRACEPDLCLKCCADLLG